MSEPNENQQEENTPESPKGVVNPNFESPTDENKNSAAGQPVEVGAEDRGVAADSDEDDEKD